jgi:hypothetical protein
MALKKFIKVRKTIMKTRLLLAVLAIVSLPIFAMATNYDVSIEQGVNQYMCLDSTNGAYFVKLGTLEFAGFSTLYTHPRTDGATFVEMYSPVIMCTGKYEATKTLGIFTVHGWRDQTVTDLSVADSGFCAVANKPPEINSVFATTPKRAASTSLPKMQSFDVRGTLSDDNSSGAAGLEWKLESSCFNTVEGNGFSIDKTILIPAAVKNCKIKLTVEDRKEGYAFTEFFVPFKKITPSN